MKSKALALFCAAIALGTVGCTRGGAQSAVVLPSGDACADAYFWGASDSGAVAVTLFVDARDRSRHEATTIRFGLPDPAIEVEMLRGEDLSRNFCTDLPSQASNPESRQVATAGGGKITLGPTSSGTSCGTVTGELELNGLVAQDGTIFAPIRITSDSIGCYSG